MTESLAPRWALSGPFMTQVMGGGGTRESFKRLVTHMSPGAQIWADDMAAHAVDRFEPGLVEELDASVQEMLEGRDLEAYGKHWGESLAQVFALKDRAAVAMQTKKNKMD